MARLSQGRILPFSRDDLTITSYIIPVKREGEKISFLFKTASYRIALFCENTTPTERSACIRISVDDSLAHYEL